MSTTDAARGPGRPRSARAHGAILEAALELLVEDGFQGMSMEAVAARAGVGKATIYRRWSSKEDLVVDAVGHLKMLFADVDTGSARDDLIALGRQVLPAAISHRATQLMPKLMSEAAKHPELHAAYHRNLVAPRRRVICEVLRRGVERGEIRDDVDLDLLVDMVVGPFIYRIIVSGGNPTFELDLPERLVDALFDGIATDPGHAANRKLPG
ncbi:MAG TPA: TetR/AcrR family transcriptional regulator [Actinomycetes bacterium]|jgi:AcrR family transcriptional regulator|nr:TetR/AcrR family transcriptional regulator [Actinomycetes bacterium]